VIGQENDHSSRWIKEVIVIHRYKGQFMNSDTGSYCQLSTCDKLLLSNPAHLLGNDKSLRKVDTHSDDHEGFS